MQIIESLKQFLGLTDVTFTNFGEFVPWFATLCLTIFVLCFIFKCFFMTAHKLERGAK